MTINVNKSNNNIPSMSNLDMFESCYLYNLLDSNVHITNLEFPGDA